MSLPSAASPTADAVAALHVLDGAVHAATGHEAFPEALWRAIAAVPAQCTVVVDPDGHAAVVTFPSDSFRAPHREVAVAARSGTGPALLTSLVRTALAGVSEPLTAWVPGSDRAVVEALAGAGMAVARRQFRMRVGLPVAAPAVPDGVALRPFVPGADEDAWLAVNNRAFANHPDQGGWIRSQLERRMAEPWFDPAGFLLAVVDARVAGFCWTKVHGPTPPEGEIFVIGVDPDAAGHGLGRVLVLAGLDHLARVRACPTALLYVAEDNQTAIALYRSIGFAVERTDTALERR